ncbi:MAG: hypothetical protein MK138_12705, partial [Planctomycetes bacterium]|nr:hypothetical protein [Planctomycetota bacterium]
MEGSHTVPPDPLDESLARIVGVNSPELRLHRTGALALVLADAGGGCQRAAAHVSIGKRGLDKAVQKATFELMTQLKQR